MSGGERKYFAAAVALSLLLATVIFLPVIGTIGVSEFGEMMLGQGEIMQSANSTYAGIMYNNTAGFIIVIVPSVCIGLVLAAAILYFLGKSIKEENKSFSTERGMIE